MPPPPDDGTSMDTLTLNLEIVQDDGARVELPAPPAGCGWRIEWSTRAEQLWHVVAEELGAGSHRIPDLPPVARRGVHWRAVAIEGPAGDGVFAPATRHPDLERERRAALRCHRCGAPAQWRPWGDVWVPACAAHAPEDDYT